MIQHLYIMQNCHGLIKIGRSQAPDYRLKQLEQTEACAISMVTVVHGAGDREESVHAALADCRVIGEWFEGDIDTRDRISSILGQPISWPHDLAEEGAITAWLDVLDIRRRRRTAKREFGRCLLDMDRSVDRGENDRIRWFDTHIWSTIWRHERGTMSIIFNETDASGAELMIGHLEGDLPTEVVPRYTRDVAAALSLFPDASRPANWQGDAWDCCRAALRARIDAL